MMQRVSTIADTAMLPVAVAADNAPAISKAHAASAEMVRILMALRRVLRR